MKPWVRTSLAVGLSLGAVFLLQSCGVIEALFRSAADAPPAPDQPGIGDDIARGVGTAAVEAFPWIKPLAGAIVYAFFRDGARPLARGIAAGAKRLAAPKPQA